ncbi:MAG: class I SAM-dependent methyltransferase [Candidatus Binatia bacterium]
MDPRLYRSFYEIEEHFWWSVGTRRVFFDTIHECLERTPMRVLDVGCGTGIMLRELPRVGATACGLDASALALSFCRQRGLADLVRGDATRLPFKTDALELVLALDLVEHVADDLGCVQELARVCRVGGHLLIHVPAFPFLWTRKDVMNHHYRRYRRDGLARIVRQCGLHIVRLFYINAFVFPVAVLQSIAERAGDRVRSAAAVDADGVERLYRIPATINRWMLALMKLEGALSRRARLPFGMSLVCLAEKRA